MKLTVFRYGTTEIPEAMIFLGGSREVKCPVSLLFYLLEIDGKSILIDTGCDTMPGFHLWDHCSPVNVLESYISRKAVTHILLTHAHHDHIDGLRYYPQAEVYLQETELSYGRRYAPSPHRLKGFSETFTVATGVTMRHIGGHTIGSSIVQIETESTCYILCGDECYTQRNFTDNIPIGASRCPEKNLAFLTEYRKPGYQALLFHETELLSKNGWASVWDFSDE